MINGIDFSMGYPVQITLIASVFFPIVLMIIARIHKLSGRNDIQFTLSFIITSIAWLGVLGTESICVSFFLYIGIILCYLEIWGLLSRGYTLGLLLTFYKANTPLSASELAGLYRGGEGLEWLITHRFAGLASAKMIERQGDKITLTTRGTIVAFLYKLSLLFFGLRYSG